MILGLSLFGTMYLSACRDKNISNEDIQVVDTATNADTNTDETDTDETGETGEPEESIVVEESVGEDGAILDASNGEHTVVLEIPAGALGEDVDIRVETAEIEDLAATIDEFADVSGTSWVFTPHGTTFENQIVITLSHDGAADAVLRLDDENDSTWEMVPNVNFGLNTLSFMSNTFSVYVPVSICSAYCRDIGAVCSGLDQGTCMSTCQESNLATTSSCFDEVDGNISCLKDPNLTADAFDCTTGAPLSTSCQTEQANLQDCATGGSCSDLSGSWAVQISLNGQAVTTENENGNVVDLTLVGVVEPEIYSSVSSYVQAELSQSEYLEIFKVNFGALDINGQSIPEEVGELSTMFMGKDTQGNFKLVYASEQNASVSSSHMCNSDDQSLDFTLQLADLMVLSFGRSAADVDSDNDGTADWNDCDDQDASSTRISEDRDCDGVLTADDCDDTNVNSTIVATDVDCDGVLTLDDCDDSDAMTINDMDCDGVLTIDDCDDADPNSTIIATDADCDGILTADDCDDTNVNSTIVATDADCDSVLTLDDCDDTNANSTVVATDADCDGVLTIDDCDDADPNTVNDMDCDGNLTIDDCDDTDANSTIIATDADCNGVLNERMIEAWAFHSCALDSAGLATCWGENQYGQSSPPATNFERIEAGLGLSCGLDSAGAMECWGNDNYSQISTAPSGNFIDLHLGNYAACAIDTSGSLECWGNDYYSEVSNAPTSGTFTKLSGGPYNTCAIETSGAIQCWGEASYGKLSNIPSGSFTDVSVGMFTICGLDTSGSIQCWGSDIYGQTSNSPSGSFTQLVGGALHHCALDASGAIQCWGDDSEGQVSGVLSLGAFLAVSAGSHYNCAVVDTGNVYCWGDNTYAQSAVPVGLNVLF